MVVLVDAHSASASEILAAAIQENQRGLIVGQHTYGKGTVQTLFPLESVSAGLRLTTARFFSPNGRSMAGRGVEPDVSVPGSSANIPVGRGGDMTLETGIDVARQQMGSAAGYTRPRPPTPQSDLLGMGAGYRRQKENDGGYFRRNKMFRNGY